MIKKVKDVEESYHNEELVLFNINTGEFYGLQDTSYFIWKCIDVCNTLDGIMEKFRQNYEVDNEEVVYNDLKNVINFLIEERLIDIDGSL